MDARREKIQSDFRVGPLSNDGPVNHDAVLALWTREAGLAPDEARRRLGEVVLVATDGAGALAGVSTTYVREHPQLRMDLWHFRVFVAAEHRRSAVAGTLAKGARDLLRDRFVSGDDTRAAGMVFEVQNEALKRRSHAIWPTTGFAFVGETSRGAHVRVQFFPGASAPTTPGLRADRIARLSGTADDWSTETLRGRLDDAWSERLLRFWAEHTPLPEDDARARLPEVVSVLLDRDGELAGTSSVYAAEVPLVGSRRFWMFRSFTLPGAEEGRPKLVADTFATLEAEFDPDGDGPIGLCLLLSPAEAARRPEAEWRDPRIVYAGYNAGGRQVRVGYFAGARIARG